MTQYNNFNDEQTDCLREAVAYVRISSAKQGKVGSGEESQKQICYDYARYKGLTVKRVFSDVMSGKTKSRPGMDAMLAFLRSHKQHNVAVIIPEISRLARDITSHLYLRTEIMQAGGELMSPSIEFSDDPTSQLPERMMALMAEHERISISKRARAGERARLLAGYACFPAPTGYKYTPDKSLGRGSVLIKVEPVASIITEALEKYAIGYFETKADVKRFLEDHPEFPKARSGKIGNSRVSDMLSNMLYAGYFEYADRDVPLTQAKHEPLISFATYQKIQKRLKGYKAPPKRSLINPEYPLRGLVDCSACCQPLKAGRSKSRNGAYHHYYSCHTRGCNVYGKSIRRDKIEGDFLQLLQELRPSPELLTIATMMFKVGWARYAKTTKDRQQAARHKLAGVEKKINNLIERIVQTHQTALVSAYESELEKLEHQRVAMSENLTVEIAENNTLGQDFEQAYRTAMKVISNPKILWENQDVRLKRIAVKYAFSSRLRYDRENGYRTGQKSLPFQVFQRLSLNSKGKNMPNERMVGDTGIEPVTPTMSRNNTFESKSLFHLFSTT